MNGYTLKDRSYSKKLRIKESICYQINTINRNVLNTTPLPLNEFGWTILNRLTV